MIYRYPWLKQPLFFTNHSCYDTFKQERLLIKLLRNSRIPYLQSDLLNNSGLVDHAFSTRVGGCSKGKLKSLNTAFHNGDDQDNVIENRIRFFNLFSYNWKDIVSSIQVHGSELFPVSAENRGEGAFSQSDSREADALITAEYGLPVAAYSADCLLIYFLSPHKPLVALAHAGWRGTLGRIGVRVVNYLKHNYNSNPADLIVAFSPSICKKCYTVDDRIAAQFRSAGWGEARHLEYIAENKWGLDLVAINRDQLTAAGLNTDNIEINTFCTSCSPEYFYSYRRDQGITGRMIGFIAIRDDSGGSNA